MLISPAEADLVWICDLNLRPEFVEPQDFSKLLLGEAALLDVRSEGEFQAGQIPCSNNVPILNDSERKEVGIRYKQEGSEAAITLGNQLVSGSIKEERLREWIDFAEKSDCAGLLCWRGGMRSETAQDWISKAGVALPRVRGGYKALRNFLLKQIAEISTSEDFTIIAGRTGSGKTQFLSKLAADGRAVLDLESLAAHKGSAFGGLFAVQPAPATFENYLSVELMKLRNFAPETIFVEDESRLIGVLSLPIELHQAKRKAKMIVLETSLSKRIENILNDYVKELFNKLCRSNTADPHQELALLLSGCVKKIRKRLGDERAKTIQQKIIEAARQQRLNSDFSSHAEWIEPILNWYYDPQYDFQLQKNSGRIVFRGNWGEICSWLNV